MVTAMNVSKDTPFEAEMRATRNSIKGIMDWDAASYTAYVKSVGRADFFPVISKYRQICAQMQRMNGQWAANLMLEWDDEGKKSSLQSAFPKETAPNIVDERASHRFEYLSLVYECLTSSEKRTFGDYLSPTMLATGRMPDIFAAYTVYKLQDNFKVIANELYDTLTPVPADRRAQMAKMVPHIVTFNVEQLLSESFSDADANEDSLFARLLLNTSVNRCCLELAEYERADAAAEKTLSILVDHLTKIFGQKLPAVDDDQSILEVVHRAMCQPLVQPWRSLQRENAMYILSRAKKTPQVDAALNFAPVEQVVDPRQILMMALVVAWDYCTSAKHDNHVVGVPHRTRQVINGRSNDDPDVLVPSLLAYHRRQFMLLSNSGQAMKLSLERLKDERLRTMSNNVLSRMLMRKLKSRSVAQWQQLDRVLSRNLKGTAWKDFPSYL